MEDVVEVKKLIKMHFESIFKEANTRRPVPKGIVFKYLIKDNRVMLDALFTVEEVKNAV